MRRVGITGWAHEVNALADPVTLAEGIDVARTPGGLGATWEAGALVRRLREAGDVEVVELPVWELGASGPLDGDDFRTIVGQIDAALTKEVTAGGPLDGVVVLGHGAGRSTDDLDPDATMLAVVRRHAGAAPVAVVLDFHANLSTTMCDLVDVVVGYRTNPHVDIQERLVEAADQLLALLAGGATAVVRCAPPMVLPQIAQLTSLDEPLGQVVARGQELVGGGVRNVTVLGGFSLADVPDGGVSVCVSADAHAVERATAVAAELAELAWSLRPVYRVHATPVAEAVARAARSLAGTAPAVILADVADNPGGGAPGTSVALLAALLDAGITDVAGGVIVGLQCDPAVVEAAWHAGVGARLQVTFNSMSVRPLAPPLRLDATVLALVDGPLVPSRGVYAGSTRHPGRCCSLALGDGSIHVGVSSHRVQCADDDTLRHVGLDPARAKVVVVKSRGHFRAGFDHLFAPEQIVEVGAPGVATPDLASVPWQHLRRPVFPLDPVEQWHPEPTVHRARGQVRQP